MAAMSMNDAGNVWVPDTRVTVTMRSSSGWQLNFETWKASGASLQYGAGFGYGSDLLRDSNNQSGTLGSYSLRLLARWQHDA